VTRVRSASQLAADFKGPAANKAFCQ